MTITFTAEEMREIASRSEFHARALSLLLMMQQGIERQRHIWEIRADVKRHTDALRDAKAALTIEEEAHKLDRQLGDTVMGLLEDAGDRAVSAKELGLPQP